MSTEATPQKVKRTSKVSRRKPPAPKDNFVPDVSEVIAQNPVPRKSKSKKKRVTETVPPTPSIPETTMTSKRRVLDKQELESKFDQYITLLESELNDTRSNKERFVSVRTWSALLKDAKRLKSTSIKAMKKPKKRNTNATSGFMKPVKISGEMASFAGWNEDELKSRVDVTKYLCQYISENNLQNPADRREIVADDKLKRLLNYDQDLDGKPLTYYYLQKKIQQHFT